MALSAPDIRLSVERIVFDGLPLPSCERFLRAFHEECVSGLATARFAPTGTVTSTRASIDVAPDATPETVGRALARALIELVQR